MAFVRDVLDNAGLRHTLYILPRRKPIFEADRDLSDGLDPKWSICSAGGNVCE